jgi:protein-tyrosine phosphatase
MSGRSGFVDLHCHCIPAVDDGVRSLDESLALLRGLRAIGFETVVATPHMRPALWDNLAAPLRAAFEPVRAAVESGREAGEPLPALELSAEHFFDDVIYGRLLKGEGLPYRAGRSLLIEFAYEALPVNLPARLFDLRMKRLRPVVAHPERYEPFWKKPGAAAQSMRKAGGVLLLDVAALVGKYGRKAMNTAEALVEEGAYYAACTDSHRPEDVPAMADAIAKLRTMAGEEEIDRMLRRGPREILEGRIFDDEYE